MQEFPLTVDTILRRCLDLGGAKEVVSVTPGGIDRRTWADVGRRALRLCRVLDRLGVARGGRVGTFAWNGHRHVELHLAAPCSGRVVHPVNLRLTDDQIVYLVRHAGDEVVFVDASLTSQIASLKHRLPVREFVVMEDGAAVDDAFAGCPRYEELLAAEPPDFAVSGLDERDAAWICYTSGTTGSPKGVVATHRSVVLHALGAHGVDSHGISRDDTVLLTTALFHVGGWGMPYTCALAPAGLVLPGRDTSPDALGRLIEAEHVTVATGVPTIWIQMEEAFAAGRYDLSSLRTVLCGGASATNALIRRINRHGIDFVQAWGMTEMSPSGTACRFRADSVPDDPESRGVAKAGVAVPGVELRIVDERGDALPWDGAAIGELEARGPWVIRAYLDPDDDANETRFDDGWLRTGDLARIEPDGTVEIVDRAKDLIKSGGEWISSLDLERALCAHPDVKEAAVVAMPHPRWGERPAAVVVPKPGRSPSPEELREFLTSRVAKWALPDVLEIVAEIPKTGVGKYDKRRLRERFAGLGVD